MGKGIRCLLWSAILAAGTATADEEFFVDLNAGITNSGADGFNSASTADISGSVVTNDFIFSVGSMVFDRFELNDSDADAYIESKGVYLKAAKIVEFNPFNIELGAGLLRNNSKSYFHGRQVGKSENSTPFLQVRGVKDISSLISLSVGYTYIDDLAGTDASLINAGIRFRF